jgi:hypothetical protein
MLKRLAMVFLTAAVLAASLSVANEQDVTADQPSDSPAFTVVRAHALGLWYPDGAGEIQPGRDPVVFDSAVAPGLSIEFNHRPAGSGFGIGLGTRFSQVTFNSDTLVYGGGPPWGWIHSSSTTYTLIEPFVGIEFGSPGGFPRSHRFSAQVGYHSLESSEGFPRTLSGVSIALEFGLSPAANRQAGSLLDLTFRGSAILPQGDRDDVMILLSLGIGINHRFK